MLEDQAQHLRNLVRDARSQTGDGVGAPAPQGPLTRVTRARTMAFTGGKGGVGKSNLAVALAVWASRAGQRVALLDADLGLAKLHVLLGLSPKRDLRDVLSGEAHLRDTLVEGPEGIQVLAGASGLTELANLDTAHRQALLTQLDELTATFDLLLLDTGAGIGENVVSFVAAADDAVVVTTPEPTSLADAYALIKVIIDRRGDLPLYLVMNNAETRVEAKLAAQRVDEVAQRFLHVPVAYAGSLPVDPAVGAAVRARVPFLLHDPQSRVSRAFADVAARLLPDAADAPANAIPETPPPTFAQRLAGLFLRGRR